MASIAGCATAEGEKVASGEAAVVGDISSMQARSDGKFDVTCKDGSHEVISQDDLLANKVCGHSATSLGTVFGNSDSCASSSLVAYIRDTTDCNSLGSASAWSIMVDGKCVDISDTTATNACQEVKRRAPTGYTIYGSSDSCAESSILTTMRENTDCSTLSASGSAWSIKIKDQCIDISDTNPQKACEILKSRIPTGYSIFGNSDSCAESSLLTNMREDTDCSTLSASGSAWSIKIKDQCIDISDTNPQKACEILKSRIPTGYSIFGNSDSCADSSLITNIRETTDCNTLSDSQSSWSISINGQCIDLSDTNVRNACVELKRRIP